MHIRVGLPAGSVHTFELADSATINDVVCLVVEKENIDLRTHRIRFVAAGKFLNDSEAVLHELVSENDFIHCAVSEKSASQATSNRTPGRGPRSSSNESEPENTPGTRDLNSRVEPHPTSEPRDEPGPTEETAQEPEQVRTLQVLHTVGESDDVRIIIPTLTVRGFDRLREAGFSDAEVAAIRRQFRIARGLPSNADPSESSDADVDTEEAWLNSAADDFDVTDAGDGRGDPRVVVTAGIEGSHTDFLLGCVCGYLLGVLTLALLLDKNISRRWRVGIIAGVATNCAFGLLRSSLYVNQTPFPAT